MEYKVTNLTKEPRRFRDKLLGKDIIVEPKKTIITKYPPKESSVWKIQIHTEKTEEIYNTKGGKQKDGNNK